MSDFARSPFWRAVAVALVAALFLIAIGLLQDKPVSLVSRAQAGGDSVGLFTQPPGWYATFAEDGSVMYLYDVERKGGEPYLAASYVFRAK